MKNFNIKLSPEIEQELQGVQNARFLNSLFDMHVTSKAVNHTILLTMKETYPQTFQKWIKSWNNVSQKNEKNRKIAVLFALFIPDIIEMTEYARDILLGLVGERIQLIDKKFMTNNPYFRKIQIKDQTSGPFHLSYDKYETSEIAFHNAPDLLDYGLIVPNVCCFTETVPFPLLRENNKAWMSITPNEINTMKEPIEKASGDVLTLGCGMGYYAYMTHLKPDVKSVTIIEKSTDVINLFQDVILPQFDYPEKIHIIQSDAFEYLERLEDGKFDYCFADLWEDCTQFDTYFKTKALTKRFRKTKMCHWIENSFLVQISRWLALMLISNPKIAESRDMNCLFQMALNVLPPSQKRPFRHIADILSQTPISRPEQIRELLTAETILNTIERDDFVYMPI